jgi:succinate dehydrogenase/fumarate reductase flavoprotein subunit
MYSLNFQVKDVIQGPGAMYPRTHESVKPNGTGFISAYMDALAKTNNVEIFYNNTAKELVKEGNRITGVKSQDRAGNIYTFTARKGVIITTGGFAGKQG